MNKSALPDLFGASPPAKRTYAKHEAAALIEVQLALRVHPAVSWFKRMNSGAVKVGNRYIRYGFPGCADFLGQLKTGRLLAVEVKGPTGRASPEQAAFLARVREDNGCAFIARNLTDVKRELANTEGKK
jgi:VRR-NUC domain